MDLDGVYVCAYRVVSIAFLLRNENVEKGEFSMLLSPIQTPFPLV